MLKLLVSILLLLSIVLLSACDNVVAPPQTIDGYYLSGAIIKSLDLDMLAVKAILKRNDTVLTDATLFIGNDTLMNISGTYIWLFDSISELSVGNHYLHISDSTIFSDSVMFSIASDFEITSRIPAGDAPLTPGNMVQLEWSTPTNVDGYVYSAVKAADIYDENGYSAFVTSGVTSVTFNADAFALPSGELDTGWYYIYIYGYKDSPFQSRDIPTVFPTGLTNSVSKLDFTAKFGSIIVTERDSIHAVTQ